MNFDSTAYLSYQLKDKLNYDDEYVKIFLGMLDGFVITPGSIKYDDENKSISFDIYLPESDLCVDEISINKLGNVYANARISGQPGFKYKILCNCFNGQINSSLLVDREDYKGLGIYYYNSRCLKNEDYKYYEFYSYFDYETVKTIRNSYVNSIVELKELIDCNPNKLAKLGFIKPDIEKWGNPSFSSTEKEKIAFSFNSRLKSFNYNKIDEFVNSFLEEYQSKVEVEPITTKK